VFINIKLSIKFGIKFVDGLKDKNSGIYKQYEVDLIIQINFAFKGCPGFNPSQTVIIRFKSGSVVAEYTTGYDAGFVVNEKDSVTNITSYIENVAFQQLKVATLNNVTADADYFNSTELLGQLKESGSQLTAAKQNPCNASTSRICTACSTCNFNVNNNDIYCSPLCKAPEQVCIFNNASDDNTANCSCAKYYLPIAGGNCVHQNVIIGVFAGVGGALVVGLLLALIITNCMKSSHKHDAKKPRKDSSKFAVGGPSGTPYEMTETSFDTPPARDVASVEGGINPAYDAGPESIKLELPYDQSPIHRVSTTSSVIEEMQVPAEIRSQSFYQNFSAQLQNVHILSPIRLLRPSLNARPLSLQVHEESWPEEERYF
jgi:hypothetical protein